MSKIRDLMKFNIPTAVSVTRGDISQTFARLQDEMNELFDRFYNGAQLRLTDWDQKAPAAPAINVVETRDLFRIEAEMAGIDPKDVEVEIAGGYLTLKGERKEEKEEKQGKDFLHREICYGSFLRSVQLPETADSTKTKAEFKNGILTIEVAKKADAVLNARKIEIKNAA